MQHLALKVKDRDEMMAMRDRLRAKGVPVLGPMDHGMCVSMYFAGPENLSLELSYSSEPINNASGLIQRWLPWPAFQRKNWSGIKTPQPSQAVAAVLPNPPLERSTGPHMTNYPPGHYEASMSIPDEVVLTMVESEPPVSA